AVGPVHQPDQQLAEVPPPGPTTPDTPGGGAHRRRVADLLLGQWHRHRPGVRRQDLHHLPAATPEGRVPRHGDRPRDRQEDHRLPGRPHLAGHGAPGGCGDQVHAAGDPHRDRRRDRDSPSNRDNRRDRGDRRASVGRRAGVDPGDRRRRQRRGDDFMTDPLYPMQPPTPIEVLLVEDDPGDVLMTREAFEDYKVHNNLAVVTDGAEALAYMRREGQYADVPRPDLVLLDLNLPRRDGREVLAEIKNDPELRQIPVVVLTTSQANEDILRSYQLHANAYVTKPVDFDRFISVVRRIDEFFVSV